MKHSKLISFDLQGTLSDSAFSDEFWLELLPALYAEKHRVSLMDAKKILEMDFRSIGKYDALFYNHRLRLNQLLTDWKFQEIIQRLKNKPKLDLKVLNIIKRIPKDIPVIILSATTRDFIEIELGYAKKYFNKTFSAIDDFNTSGKPPSLFRQIAQLMDVEDENCLHIGDCREMDVDNAKKADWNSYHLDSTCSRKGGLSELKITVQNFLQDVLL